MNISQSGSNPKSTKFVIVRIQSIPSPVQCSSLTHTLFRYPNRAVFELPANRVRREIVEFPETSMQERTSLPRPSSMVSNSMFITPLSHPVENNAVYRTANWRSKTYVLQSCITRIAVILGNPCAVLNWLLDLTAAKLRCRCQSNIALCAIATPVTPLLGGYFCVIHKRVP